MKFTKIMYFSFFIVLAIVFILTPLMVFCEGQQFSGQSITVVTLEGAQSNGVKAVVPLFEEATGAKVNVEAYPWGSFLEKVMLDLSTGMGSFDLIVTTANQIGSFVEGDFILPFEEFIDDPEVADPNLNIEEISPALLEIASWKGRLYGLPFKPDMQLLFYRKDLFEDPEIKKKFKSFAGRDLDIPNTTDEFLEVARFFTKKYNPDSPTEYGTAVMGKKGNQTHFFWTPRLFAYGGDFFTEDMKPGFDNEAGIKALQFIIDVLKYSPPESPSYDFPEVNSEYLNGNIAMFEQWIEFASYAENPKLSKVIGKTGYALPVGVMINGKFSRVSDSSSINSFVSKSSKNPILAYKFAEYMTFPPAEKVKIPAGVMPVRNTTLLKWEKEYPFFDALRRAWEIGVYCKPNVPESEELLEVIRINFTMAFLGEMTAESAIHDAADKWREILKRAGYFY